MILVDYQDYMGWSLETWLLVNRFYTWTTIIWSVLWHCGVSGYMRPLWGHRMLLSGHRTRPLPTGLKHRELRKISEHRTMATGRSPSVRCHRAPLDESLNARHRTRSAHCAHIQWVHTGRSTTSDALGVRPMHLYPEIQQRTLPDFHPTKFQLLEDSNKHRLELVWVTSLKPSNFHKNLALGIVVFYETIQVKALRSIVWP